MGDPDQVLFYQNLPSDNFSNFLICYLVAPQPALNCYWGNNLTHSMLINALYLQGVLWWGWAPESGRAPSGVWTGNFLIYSQGLHQLGHCPRQKTQKSHSEIVYMNNFIIPVFFIMRCYRQKSQKISFKIN